MNKFGLSDSLVSAAAAILNGEQPEIKKEQLYIDIWNPSQMAFMDMMSRYYDSQKRSALFICQDSPDITWSQVERKPIQITLNKKYQIYINILK